MSPIKAKFVTLLVEMLEISAVIKLYGKPQYCTKCICMGFLGMEKGRSMASHHRHLWTENKVVFSKSIKDLLFCASALADQ